MITFECYRGTSRKYARNILSDQKFKVSKREDHWLGNGAYFFINDRSKAEWWAKSIGKRCSDGSVVIQFGLSIKEKELLNLNSESDLSILDNFAENFFNDLEKYGIDLKFESEHHQNCMVLDAFFDREENYKAVRRTFESTRSYIGSSGFAQLSDQLCVTNQSIIPFSRLALTELD